VFVHQLLDDVDDPSYCIHNAGAVRSVLDESGKVRAVFQGHRHKDRYNKLKGIHYCTLPAMVDYSGLENNSFSIIEVYPDGLNMLGYKRAASRRM
jgi:alkaline phosphatase